LALRAAGKVNDSYSKVYEVLNIGNATRIGDIISAEFVRKEVLIPSTLDVI
jgi:hypothetical protein